MDRGRGYSRTYPRAWAMAHPKRPNLQAALKQLAVLRSWRHLVPLMVLAELQPARPYVLRRVGGGAVTVVRSICSCAGVSCGNELKCSGVGFASSSSSMLISSSGCFSSSRGSPGLTPCSISAASCGLLVGFVGDPVSSPSPPSLGISPKPCLSTCGGEGVGPGRPRLANLPEPLLFHQSYISLSGNVMPFVPTSTRCVR